MAASVMCQKPNLTLASICVRSGACYVILLCMALLAGGDGWASGRHFAWIE